MNENTGTISAPLQRLVMRRFWEMPSKWTFKMRCIQALFGQYNVGIAWADPFAGMYSPAEISNDLEGRMAKYQMDALDFLKSLPSESVAGVLFDPPYSVEQCLRKYTPRQNGTAGRAEYWARCKDEIGRIVRSGGMAISFCWDSTGIGKRGVRDRRNPLSLSRGLS